MFTSTERERLLQDLVERARADPRITAVALFGSAALEGQDEWSDIDLALAVVEGVETAAVLDDWTQLMSAQHDVVAQLDISVDTTIYRVFLLPSTLQVDLAFAPAASFRPRGPAFRLLYGSTAAPPDVSSVPEEEDPGVGMGWLYALHARSSLARGRWWQAEYMISGLRDQVLELACRRHGLAASQGRGLHLLPQAFTDRVQTTLVPSVGAHELHLAFSGLVDLFLEEVGHVEPALGHRLSAPLHELVASARPSR